MNAQTLYKLFGISYTGSENSPHYVGINEYKAEDGRVYLIYHATMLAIVMAIIIKLVTL